MLKLPKGLKKKKKDKKKKNQELFTEEELEQYKREQKARQEAAAAPAEEEAERQQQLDADQAHQANQSKPKAKTDDDEWSKFTQLTSGVDSILKKTQGNLEKIKESSFYQRVDPPKQKPEAVKSPESEGESSHAEKPQEPELTEEELEEQRRQAALKEAVVELSDSEEESEEADDIFDTNYIDELASGNLPLAYIPDSPTEEEDLGPDPFDTNFADKLIKGPEVSKRGKKIVNIGAAVGVLTGRVENVALNKEALKRPRRGPQNLLLESFDKDNEATGETELEAAAPVAEEKPALSLLDDISDDIPDIPVDLSASLHLTYLKQKEEEEKEAEKRRLEQLELEKDEFDELAAESLTKNPDEVKVVDPNTLATVLAPVLEDTHDWLELQKDPEGIIDVDDLDDLNEAEVDPFDTEFVGTVVREKSIDDDEFDPRAGEEPQPVAVVQPETTLTVKPKDLLSGSTSDLTDLSHIPVIAASESIEVEIDPFDTSAVISLVQPKETEIKYLEKELLSDTLKHSLSDPDFDPRSDERVPVPTTPALTTAERKSSLVLNINSAIPKTVAFDISGNLAVGNGEGRKKPVTPYYSGRSFEDANDQDISDSEFNPRAVTPTSTQKPDLLSVSESHDTKVLTPATSGIDKSNDNEFEIDDPFDTSNISGALLPGKAELKLLENELIEPVAAVKTDVLDINSDSQELGLGAKVLTPQISLPVEDSFDDVDPFDTSFASNIAPGQAEIKILESELIHK